MRGDSSKPTMGALCHHPRSSAIAPHFLVLPNTVVQDLAKRLGITTSTLYMYVNGDGSVKDPGQKLLDAAQDA